MTDKTEPVADSHSEACEKLDRLLVQHAETIKVLQAHGRIIEKHAETLDEVGKVMRSIDAGVASVRDAQRAQNQLTANMHLMYSQLACVKGDDPDPDCPDEFRERTPSEELRQLRALSVGGNDD